MNPIRNLIQTSTLLRQVSLDVGFERNHQTHPVQPLRCTLSSTAFWLFNTFMTPPLQTCSLFPFYPIHSTFLEESSFIKNLPYSIPGGRSSIYLQVTSFP